MYVSILTTIKSGTALRLVLSCLSKKHEVYTSCSLPWNVYMLVINLQFILPHIYTEVSASFIYKYHFIKD